MGGGEQGRRGGSCLGDGRGQTAGLRLFVAAAARLLGGNCAAVLDGAQRCWAAGMAGAWVVVVELGVASRHSGVQQLQLPLLLLPLLLLLHH